MLAGFKRDYLRHGEFLLAPVVQRDDDQFWFNIEAGIIKRKFHLRHASEIGESDPDAIVLHPPASFAVDRRENRCSLPKSDASAPPQAGNNEVARRRDIGYHDSRSCRYGQRDA